MTIFVAVLVTLVVIGLFAIITFSRSNRSNKSGISGCCRDNESSGNSKSCGCGMAN